MANFNDQKCRKCRRAGQKLFLKGERCFSPKCAFSRRSYPPGNRGVRGFVRKSVYGQQLQEKQKAKNIYGLLERQFRNYYENATKLSDTGLGLLTMLETRLDNVIKRGGLASSIRSARQLISHELIHVNDKKVKSPGYQVKVGDKVGFRNNNKIEQYFSDAPGWLKRDDKRSSLEVVAMPKREEMNQELNEELIIELYSR